MPNTTNVTNEQHNPVPVVPSLEAYDVAMLITFHLVQLMALAFDPRIDSWEDFGAVVDSVAFDLATAYPLTMASNPKRKHFRFE